uniref:Ground-like domain-containing protein n=1 Tax=Caenorhabditis tropicalis TaxID=1561998 RepID=A0A1I7T8D2_9PELO
MFGGGGGCSSGSGGCASAASQFSAPMPPPMYAFTPQVYSVPPPPPPPPAPARQLPSSVVIPVSAASSYQGMYQDRPQAPSINPDYQGTAPLSFAGEVASSEDAANTVLDPLKYIEHVSVSHTPSIEVGPPAQEAYPPSPADPFGSITVEKKTQIQVAPSSASTEDTYLPGPPEKETNATHTLNTYYNQMCTGEKITVGEKETIGSATKKCELLKCMAVNAQPDSHGSYTVTYLSTASSRSNSKGNYCLSTKDLPVKSKRVIRKFDEMVTSEEESTNAVRRKIFKL